MLTRTFLFKLALAWRNLIHKPQLLFSALIAVTLAVFIVFSQAGFFFGITESPTFSFEHFSADLIVVSKSRYASFFEERFDRDWLEPIKSLPEVEGAYPIYLTIGTWKNLDTGHNLSIRVFGVNPADPVFDESIQPALAALNQQDTVIIDRRSRQEYGFEDLKIGDFGELSNRRLEVVGDFEIGADIVSDGNLILSDLNFLRTFARVPNGFNRDLRPNLTDVDFGLIQLKPGIKAKPFAQQLSQILPDSLTVMTQSDFLWRDFIYQLQATPTGFIFALGLLVGLVVGSIVIFNIIYTDILRNLPQYATLRAMGYSNNYLMLVVFIESFIIALLGFVPGWLVSQILYRLVSANTGLIMRMTPELSMGVLVATILMCLLGGLIASQKLRQIDPSEIY